MLCTLLLALPQTAAATTVAPSPQEEIEQVVRQLYAAVSYAPGASPEWDHMGEVFLPQALLVLAYPEGSAPRIQSREDFIQEYRQALQEPASRASGFLETPTYLETMIFGNIAHVDAVFEAHMPPDGAQPVRRGIDSIQLIKSTQGWKVLTLTSEIVGRHRPLGKTPPARIASDWSAASSTGEAAAQGQELTAAAVGFPSFERVPLGSKWEQLRNSGKTWLPVLYRRSMHLGLYQLAAGNENHQNPHEEDEVYYVLAGKAKFRVDGKESEVAVGDLLYVDAGLEHRFHDIQEDLELLVFFSIRH